MENANLLDGVHVKQITTVTQGAAGTSAINSDIIDMAGYDGVAFLVPFGAIVSGAVTSFKVQQGNDSALSDAADLAGTGQTVADTDDDKTRASDILRPTDRYCRVAVSRATQNATLGAIIALLYRKRQTPITTLDAKTLAIEKFVSPAEGTA